ncbi:Receptor-like kinase TMK4 [Trametes pubescens]|uniref:Receptor-like kinase TMK4 n=1 Tax=Trametes pubescens TaxID=154538 RepID=A0A1M2VFV8_TRAPU|nr:Receptor-like kinase TMK4 [Trametes pubescens]
MNRHQPPPSSDQYWDRNPRPRAPLAITVPPPDYPIESSRFSPESPPVPPPTHKRSQSTWTNTNTLKSDATPPKDPELGPVSSPQAPHFRDRVTKFFFDIRMTRPRDPNLLPMQQPPLRSWPGLEKQDQCKHCHKKRKRDKVLAIVIIVLLLYLFSNMVFLNVRVLNMVSPPPPSSSSSTPPSTSSPNTLSADAQQCISQYNLNAPTDPQSYPCSTCYPVLSAVPSNFTDGNSQDAQTIANAVQFCGLRSIFETSNSNGQAALSTGGWDKDVRFCAWSGVKCDGFGRVSSLQLSFPSVPASIPTEIGGLTGLTSLQVIGDTNVPGGSLPSSFAQLTALTSLDLESTAITAFDAGLFTSLNKVTTLTLVKNANMGSELPSSVTALPLQNLVVNNQALASDTLSTLASSTSLQGSMKLLDLSSTSLSGSIPSGISSFTSLVELHLDGNSLTNPLPSSFPPSLHTLTLTNNTQLSGTVSSGTSFCALSGLQTCDMRGTNLNAQGACGSCQFQ